MVRDEVPFTSSRRWSGLTTDDGGWMLGATDALAPCPPSSAWHPSCSSCSSSHPPGSSRPGPRRPPTRRPTFLVAGLLAAFAAVLFVPALSTYFGLTGPAAPVFKVVLPAVVLWFALLTAAFRLRLLDRILGPRPD
jgi:hypothetical protein